MFEPRGEALPVPMRARLTDQICQLGDQAVASQIGRSRTAILRAALGCPVNAGTRSAVSTWLASEGA